MSIVDLSTFDRRTKRYVDDLNLILQVEDIGVRDWALEKWLNPDDFSQEQVKVKTQSGKAMQIPVRTSAGPQLLNVPPAGRKVSRRLALKLLREYGEFGKYRGRDRATGLTEFDIATLPVETIARLKGRHPNIQKFKTNPDFLVHVPGMPMNAEIDELTGVESLVSAEG